MFSYLSSLLRFLPLGGGQSSSSDYEEKYSPELRDKLNREVFEAVKENVEAVSALIRDMCPYVEIRNTLAASPDLVLAMNYRDNHGYHLLHYAIFSNQPRVVQLLLQYGVDLNLPMCARPLHLAAKLGHTDIVQILLDNGADPGVMSTVCHPHPHIAMQSHLDAKNQLWIDTCVNDIYTSTLVHKELFEFPLYHAICSDNQHTVQYLLQCGIDRLHRSTPIHVACVQGAFNCAKLFVHEHINISYKGSFPVEHAVKHGKRFVELLVLNGADIQSMNCMKENLFHTLFKHGRGNFSVTAKYLLDCGLKLKINLYDTHGNSPLISLFKNMQGCLLAQEEVDKEFHSNKFKLYLSFRKAGFTHEQADYLQTLDLILKAGANPNALHSKTRESPLRVLAQSVPIRNADISVSYRLIYHCVRMLLQHSCHMGLTGNSGKNSDLGMFFSHGCDVLFSQPSIMNGIHVCESVEVDHFIRCLKLFPTHCYEMVSSFGSSECLFHTIISRFDDIYIPPDDISPEQLDSQKELSQKFAEQIFKVLECILQCGLNPNTCNFIQTDFHLLYLRVMRIYYLLGMKFIEKCLLLFLHHEASPCMSGIRIHIEIPNFQNSKIYLFYPLVHILDVMRFTNEKELFERVLQILRNSVDFFEQKHCFNEYLLLSKTKYPKSDIDTMVENFLSSPPSLLQLTAYQVYTQQCSRNIKKLKAMNIPHILKLRMANFAL